jgi:hypothetical protein
MSCDELTGTGKKSKFAGRKKSFDSFAGRKGIPYVKRNYRLIEATFQNHVSVILGSFYDHSSGILETFEGPSIVILRFHEGHAKIILGSC